jgi:hypothetical protein
MQMVTTAEHTTLFSIDRLVVVCSRSDRGGQDVLWPFTDAGRHQVLCPTTGSHTLRGWSSNGPTGSDSKR